MSMKHRTIALLSSWPHGLLMLAGPSKVCSAELCLLLCLLHYG